MKKEFISIGRGNADVITAPAGGKDVFGTRLFGWGEQLICPTIRKARRSVREEPEKPRR